MPSIGKKFKAFSLVTYAEPTTVTEILEEKFKDGTLTAYAHILHDKDTVQDENGNDHRKEPHTHIVLTTSTHRTSSSVKNWFKATRDFKGDIANTLVQSTRSCIHKDGRRTLEPIDVQGATFYLVHEDKEGNPSPNKHHYSWEEVVSQNLDALKNPPIVNSGRAPKEDKTFEILEKVTNGDNFFDLAKEYGRDFILNWNKYKDLCQYCYGRSIEEEEKRKEKERLDFELEALAKSCERMTIEEKLKQENEILKAQLISAGIRFEKD